MLKMLTDKEIRTKKPKAKPYKLSDQGGLYLLCTPHGTRLWRLKYRIMGREKGLALGSYPEVSLAKARALQAAAKEALREGGDPMAERQRERAANRIAAIATVEAVAREWHRLQAPRWRARYAAGVMSSLERMVFPMLGRLQIDDVTPQLLLRHLTGNIRNGFLEPVGGLFVKLGDTDISDIIPFDPHAHRAHADVIADQRHLNRRVVAFAHDCESS